MEIRKFDYSSDTAGDLVLNTTIQPGDVISLYPEKGEMHINRKNIGRTRALCFPGGKRSVSYKGMTQKNIVALIEAISGLESEYVQYGGIHPYICFKLKKRKNI